MVLQFSAESCVPCKAIRSRIEAWNRSWPEVRHICVSVDRTPELCAQMGVFTVPTIFVYAEGKLTIRESGYFSLDAILNKIEVYAEMLCP